jgi:hypothetical protein
MALTGPPAGGFHRVGIVAEDDEGREVEVCVQEHGTPRSVILVLGAQIGAGYTQIGAGYTAEEVQELEDLLRRARNRLDPRSEES